MRNYYTDEQNAQIDALPVYTATSGPRPDYEGLSHGTATARTQYGTMIHFARVEFRDGVLVHARLFCNSHSTPTGIFDIGSGKASSYRDLYEAAKTKPTCDKCYAPVTAHDRQKDEFITTPRELRSALRKCRKIEAAVNIGPYDVTVSVTKRAVEAVIGNLSDDQNFPDNQPWYDPSDRTLYI